MRLSSNIPEEVEEYVDMMLRKSEESGVRCLTGGVFPLVLNYNNKTYNVLFNKNSYKIREVQKD